MDRILRSSSKYCNNGGEDRISSLTDDVLHQILSFLNTKYAVQTCVLSKRWISVWKSLPFLDFDYSSFPIFSHIFSFGDEEQKEAWLLPSFTSFISHVLARRYSAANLVKVRFNSSSNPRIDPLLAESVICYAVQHNVQILDVNFSSEFHSGDDCMIRWPQSFYTCQSLATLKLQNHQLLINKASIQLPKYLSSPALKSLHLFDFVMNEDFDPRVFSSCPNLETLELDIRVLNLTVLKIHALNLRKLKLSLAPEWRGCLKLSLAPEWRGWKDKCKFEILAPKLTTFKYNGNGYVHIVQFLANLASLDDVDFDLFPNPIRLGEEKEANVYEYFNMFPYPIEHEEEDCFYLINTLKEFLHAKSLTLSWQTLEVLSTYPALLDEYQLSFTGLKNLKLKVGLQYDAVEIPSAVLNHFVNSSTSLKICW